MPTSVIGKLWAVFSVISTLSVLLVFWNGWRRRRQFGPWFERFWLRRIVQPSGVTVTVGRLVALCQGLHPDGKRAALKPYRHRCVLWVVRIDAKTADSKKGLWMLHGGHIHASGAETGGVFAHFRKRDWQKVAAKDIGWMVEISGYIIDVNGSATLYDCRLTPGFRSLLV